MTNVENALDDARIEYVEETTETEPPTDPSWSVLSDYLTELIITPSGNREGQMVVGSADYFDHFRGPEEPEFTTNYFKQQDFIGSGGSENYPAAYPLTYEPGVTEVPSYTFEYRREVNSGGNDGAGFREYAVAFGAKPIGVSDPGDPSEAQPIVEELSWAARRFRTYVIHQPSSSTTVDVTNDGTSSVDVTIENEGAGTSETITVAGGSTQTSVESFSDIDAIWVETGEHDGDIQVTDGSGTTLLDTGRGGTGLAGTNTDNVDSELGVPPLGSGSHGSAIGTSPEDYQFLGTDTLTWDGSQISDRVHTLDFSVELDVSREPIAGERGSTVDIGSRSTLEVSADLGGEYETVDLLQDHYHNFAADFLYSFPDNDLTISNATPTDIPDFTRSAGETNYLPSVTLEGEGVSLTYTGA